MREFYRFIFMDIINKNITSLVYESEIDPAYRRLPGR